MQMVKLGSLILCVLLLGGCGGGSSGASPQTGVSLPVYSKYDVTHYQGLIKIVRTYKKEAIFPFQPISSAVKSIMQSAAKDHAQALIKISEFKGNLGNDVVMDGVRWVTPTPSLIIHQIEHPRVVPYGAAYHAGPSAYPTLVAIYFAKKNHVPDLFDAGYYAFRHAHVVRLMANNYIHLLQEYGRANHQDAKDCLWIVNHYNIRSVLYAALTLYVNYSHHENLPALVNVINNNHYRSVSILASKYYAQYANRRDVNELTNLLKYQPIPDVRINAATALLRLGDRHVVATAAQIDRSNQVRSQLRHLLLTS